MNPDTSRSNVLEHIREWDVLVTGGGATGAGIALDAASRGFRTLLLEQEDFGKGTSSRSTRLVHGGVRYLAQGDLLLVTEALHERGMILKNAPNLTFNQEFVIPAYTWWEILKYTAGLKFYDLLAGRLSLGKSKFLNRENTLALLPGLNKDGLKGGIVYHDGQFDDSRLLITLIRTILDQGGMALNYCKVTGLLKNGREKITGVTAVDQKTGRTFEIQASVVVNATGVFADEMIRMDSPVTSRTIRPSQGVHIVLNRDFLGSNAALMIPKTDDERVLFAIPWHNRLVVGTTDTPVDTISLEPKPLKTEIDFILRTAGKYLTRQPTRDDILSVYAGLRPLVSDAGNPEKTREISRRHKIVISPSGLVTVEGGKWTIYRRMAQDTVNRIIRTGMLEKRACNTEFLKLHGMNEHHHRGERLDIYGVHASEILEMVREKAEDGIPLHPHLPYTPAEIKWICRNEMPYRLEDVLARRTRALFLDAAASLEMAPEVAAIMAGELHMTPDWEKQQTEEYTALVTNYLCR
ncbi:MAG: glycerol-3-phosphate dehydrogenase/oxidase [Bacteroidales bacterium]|nr:glycerol-3-phosphate dehydrogenase/oxidase [Bacteroidales bacterium]